MADDETQDKAPSRRRQEQQSSGEGTQVSGAPTDKPVEDEPYVGVDDIYRNHAEDTNAPLLADEGDEGMRQVIEDEHARRLAAEREATLGAAGVPPNPNLDAVEPTDPERAEKARERQNKREEAQRRMDEEAERQMEQRRQAEAESIKAQAENLRRAADRLEQSAK